MLEKKQAEHNKLNQNLDEMSQKTSGQDQFEIAGKIKKTKEVV